MQQHLEKQEREPAEAERVQALALAASEGEMQKAIEREFAEAKAVKAR